ncbi:MAG: flagellar hook-length control protein FliK [Clostridium sp.]|nr:flagellar hook-length control protein FliK [Acetatifactor muris]MCM1526014.1 flagellar hook-length control protein FliK [Bacteroides sp.]MCM1562226.1 flagellar hook-length control protein FliK [Clostridium sp.]
MTTSSIKDVGNVMHLGVQAGNASAKTEAGGFSTVWNSHAGNYKAAPQKEQPAEKTTRQSKPGDDLRAKDSSGKYTRKTDADVEQPGEMSEEEMKAAMENATVAVMQLMQEIADAFGIPVEDVQDLMQEMDLQPLDLLQPENLSNLFLEAGDVEGSLALLTDEQLYADYRTIMEDGQAALEQNSAVFEQSVAGAEETPELPVDVTGSDMTPVAEVVESATEMPKDEKVEEPDVAKVGEKTNPDILSQPAEESATENVQTVQRTQENAKEHEPGHKDEGKSHDGNGNLVLQTIRDEAFQPQAGDVQAAQSARDVDTQDIMRQIMDYMRIQVKQDMSSLEMQLHPANLGTLQIQVAAKGGVLTANFVTQNEAVKAALESQMVQLRESFEEQGVKVEAIEVTVQTHQFEQNLEQGRERQPQEATEGKRPRTRRIRLDGVEGAELPEEMDGEDRITAEMMAANGNTVDYTA